MIAQVAYHNWKHAFNVAQMMFATITATQWNKKLGDVSIRLYITKDSGGDFAACMKNPS